MITIFESTDNIWFYYEYRLYCNSTLERDFIRVISNRRCETLLSFLMSIRYAEKDLITIIESIYTKNKSWCEFFLPIFCVGIEELEKINPVSRRALDHLLGTFSGLKKLFSRFYTYRWCGALGVKPWIPNKTSRNLWNLANLIKFSVLKK